jgi:endoglucanase
LTLGLFLCFFSCHHDSPTEKRLAASFLPLSKAPIDLRFIRASGIKLVVGEKSETILLNGVCFGNNVWANPKNPVENHHTESDFAVLKSVGANAVRFYLNYGLFEDDSSPYLYKKSGFDWLDQNIAWAEKYGIY